MLVKQPFWTSFRQDEMIWSCKRAKITQAKNNPVYSIWFDIQQLTREQIGFPFYHNSGDLNIFLMKTKHLKE